MNDFQTIDLALLSTATGGAAQQPAQQDDAPPTWGQVARDYANACVTGAGEMLMFGGKPKGIKQAAATAAMGCAMGVGMKAVTDVSSYVTGGR